MKNIYNIFKTTNVLIIITTITKIFGFAREMVLANFYGISNISDAFLLSQNLPITIFGLFTMALATSFIPVYNSENVKNGVLKANHFMSNLINIVFILCSIIIFLCFIFANPIIRIMASGFSDETINIAVYMMRITVFTIYFIALFTIIKGYLQIKNKYIISVIGGLILDLIMIAVIMISYRTTYILLAIGLLISYAIQFAILVPTTLRTGYKHKLVFEPYDTNVKNIIVLSWPVMVGTAVSDCNVVIDNILASRAAIGGISILNYSSKINGIAQGIFIATTVMVFFPKISMLYENNEQEKIWKYTEKTILDVMQYIIPVMVGTIVYSKEIITVIFQRGVFDQSATNITAQVLICYSTGLIPIALREIFTKVFYARHEAKIPMRNGIIAIVINIVLNFIFIKILGLPGLALATSISIWVSVMLLVLSLRKVLDLKISRNLIICFSIQTSNALISVGVSFILYRHFSNTINILFINMVIIITVAATIYFIMLVLAKKFIPILKMYDFTN